jgi:anti-anti-sigma regulatory factor
MEELNYTAPDCAALKISGSLTIQKIAALHKLAADSLSKVRELTIDHKDADEFDLSYLQLLIALEKTSGESGRKIKITGANSETFSQLVSDSGCGAFLEKIKNYQEL